MLKQALIVASVLSAALLVGVVAYYGFLQKQEMTRLQTQLAALQTTAAEQSAQASARTALLQQQLTNRQARIDALIKEKEQVTRAQSKMEEQMRTALESKDVTISELQGKLTVNIVDRILFDSGEADLKTEGQQVLAQLAGILNQHTNRQIFVIGHTDNVPIRGSLFGRYRSNWELSTARATAAVRYLTEQAGVNPAMLAAVGYGEFHPIADNSTPEGRARNRRIAIVILPEQFNPLDMNANPSPSTPAAIIGPPQAPDSTNAPPAPESVSTNSEESLPPPAP